MSKKKPQIEVVYYHMSMHIAACLGPISKYRKIIAGDKVAWSGEITTNTKVTINEPLLFGGLRKQGGVVGEAHLMLGGASQTMSTFLCEKLNRTATTCPFYRGVASVFLTEIEAAPTHGLKGMYLQANSPVLPNIEIEAERLPVGWYEDTAGIPAGFLIEAVEEVANGEYIIGPSTSSQVAADMDARKFYSITNGTGPAGADELHTYLMSDHSLESTQTLNWDSVVTTVLNSVNIVHEGILYSDVNVTGGFGSGNGIIAIDPGTATVLSTNKGPVPFQNAEDSFIFEVDGVVHYAVYQFSGINNWKFDFWKYTGTFTLVGSSPVIATAGATVAGVHEAASDARFYWYDINSSTYRETKITSLGGIANRTIWAAPPTHTSAYYHQSTGMMLLQNGTTVSAYNFFDETFTQVYSQTVLNDSGMRFPHPTSTVAVNRIALSSAASTFAIDVIDIATGDRLGRVSKALYNTTNASWLYDDVGGSGWFSQNGGYFNRVRFDSLAVETCNDANPAHIIHEVLVDTEFGLGIPEASLDDAAFRAAALTLFNENFGISLLWVASTTGEEFIQNIIDHIEAVLYVDPNTGLLVLKLIRDDYDIDTLRTLNRSNCNLDNYRRKGLGETTNEITVTFTNRENEDEATVTLQEPGNIAAQGNIVNDSRNYFGVRSPELALTLARRDLRVASYPLATAEASVSHEFWDAVPGEAIKLDWTFRNGDSIEGMVMRITGTERDHKTTGRIRLSLVEDVFALEAATFVQPSTQETLTTNEEPADLQWVQFLSLPYYWAVNLIDASVQSQVDEASEETFFGILGAQSGSDTVQYDVYSEESDSQGNLAFVSQGFNDILARSVSDVALVQEVTTTLTGGFAALSQGAGAVVGTFVVIGDGPEEDGEIAIVSAITPNIVLKRGMLDTTPKDWPIGTAMWLVNPDSDIVDNVGYATPATVDYKLLPVTSLGTLSEAAATTQSPTLTNRHYLPLRPANVKAEGSAFGPVNAVGLTDIDMTWNRRNRLTEDSVVNYWDDADVTPEASTTVTVQALNIAKDTVLGEDTAISGTSHSILVSKWAGATEGYVRVISERGADESFQGHDIYVMLQPILDVGQGTYTLTGYSVGSINTIIADSGSYTLTGQSVGFLSDQVVAAAQGSYALFGQAVTLTYSGAVTDFRKLEGVADNRILEGGTDKRKFEE